MSEKGELKIVGIAGRAGAGKDAVAEVFARCMFYERALADSLKDAASRVFLLSRDQVHGPLKEVVDGRWGMSPREILQRMGTEAMRGEFGDDVWVRSLLVFINSGLISNRRIVVPDVRFDNEARAILDLGGRVWLVRRPGLGEVGVAGHASEAGVDPGLCQRVIDNDRDLDHLRGLVLSAIAEDMADVSVDRAVRDLDDGKWDRR